MTVTSTAVRSGNPEPQAGTDAIHPAVPRRSPGQRIWRPDDQPPWARPALIGLLAATAVLYLWGLGASGWANSYYSAAVAAGSESWTGVLLRLLRRGQLDHRGQDAGLAVGDGPVRAGVRAELLVDPGARGAGRGGRGRAALRERAALVRTRGRPARRRGHGAHPGRGPDVPVQQSGCPARAAARRRGLRHHPRDRDGQHQVARPRRCVRRVRLPDQDAAGVAGRARVRAGVPGRRAHRVGATDPPTAHRRRRHGRLGRLVDRDRATHPRLGATLHRRFTDQQRSRACPGLQRIGPPHR